ncbi:MAG: hypothetical protein A2511_11980 [Deltaproteobacteria bacterium RIFOXYD12_FULL_50_9]|nr:MAG: hypothetical protein A2511_11980 [Deltaproteobacteria bacterium RIFOXYD12_FULL_50_9]
MGSVNLRRLLLLLIIILLAGCGGDLLDDLNPSDKDQRPAVQTGTVGPNVGQNAPDFLISDSLGNSVTLSTALAEPGKRGIVLYFTMWCPTCDSEMSNMLSSHIPNFPDVRFYAVDYVSGTIAGTRNSELSNGYAGSGFTVLADTAQTLLNLYNGSMGTTVVIDKTGIIRSNENYKDDRLTTALTNLP